jgi:hypothetical protein
MQPPQTDKEIADYSAVIQMSDAPSGERARAYYNRGLTYATVQPPQTDKAIADFSAVIQMTDAPSDVRAKAYVNRGVAYRTKQPPQTDKAIADYSAVVGMADAPRDRQAEAIMYRATARSAGGDQRAAADDLKALLKWPDIAAKLRAAAAAQLLGATGGPEDTDDTMEILALSVERAVAGLPESEEGQQITAMLAELSRVLPAMSWVQAWRAMVQRMHERPAGRVLELLRPVADAIETGDRRALQTLRPEERDFAEEILRGFEGADGNRPRASR